MRLLTLSEVGLLLGSLINPTLAQVTPITAFPDYVSARACVQTAASYGLYYEGVYTLGCGQQESQACLCGSVGAVSAQISQYIYTYASNHCGDTIEASSAAGIFHEYCTASTGPPAQATTIMSTSIALNNAPITEASPASKPTNPASTPTPGPSPNGSNNGGSNTNNINIKTGAASPSRSNPTNVIVGISIACLVLAVLGLSCWLVLRRRKLRQQSHGTTDRRAVRDLQRNTEAEDNRHRSEDWELSQDGYVMKQDEVWNTLVEAPGASIHRQHGRQNAQTAYELWGR